MERLELENMLCCYKNCSIFIVFNLPDVSAYMITCFLRLLIESIVVFVYIILLCAIFLYIISSTKTAQHSVLLFTSENKNKIKLHKVKELQKIVPTMPSEIFSCPVPVTGFSRLRRIQPRKSSNSRE